ncbi:autotransporter outer membrane beta-barrel domain-containing protein [Shewanella woodyi]|uniref:Ig domain protein group 1 domain protein n=1 Tax=Shewanella woodyi (strain ATCC 51908 / MS32) TaxID=392500 RepID=B1KJH0_SHEWM|nr:Ig-like domain-containing protein [Shewanella woodyi]ACA88642.1 Ig domain protein group 1 domain protein [Shewanella woodyi ATCC 51908]
MRLIKTALVLPITLIVLALLGGCNGSSDDSSGGGGEENSGEYALSLSYKTVVDGQCAEATNDLSFSSNASICVVANLTQGGKASSGGLVSFSASLGTLAPATKLTNSSGLAEVILTPEAGTQGAGTVTAQFDTKAAENNILTIERNYEFTSTAAPSEPKFTLNSAIINGTTVVTQFKADETVQLQAQFLNEQGQGVAGKKATFTAGNANLNPNSALTKENGIAQVSYTPTESELGAANFSVTLDDEGKTYQSSGLYEVLAKDAVSDDGIIVIGYFSEDGNTFTENELATTLPLVAGSRTVSAGGTFGVTADLATKNNDGSYTRLQTPTSVSFSSSCILSNSASIDSPVTTLSGIARSTFQNTNCSGNSSRDDQIIASVVAGNQTISATLDFVLARQTLANMSFISAEPTSIRIKGAGGTGTSESSLITFKVSDANGQAIAQQTVDFTLDTTIGGISFADGGNSTSNTSNSFGLVSATVLSGTVPTPVRVLATATANNESVSSQSEQLTVNTGLPQQLGFSLSTSVANPEAGDFNGETALITAYASDSFGNPAPDDTTINFTTEGGQIEPKCLTQNGTCSVTWTSASPRVPDHRITVLAYALGHETFFDTNGNNVFDTNDYETVKDSEGNDSIKTYLACLNNQGMAKACSGNGMDIEAYLPKGLSDLPDAFRDDNENGIYELGEKYFNTNNTPEYMIPNGKFNGPQCEGDYCGVSTYIRKALVMTMSGSDADFTVYQDNVQVYSTATGLGNVTSIPVNGSSNFTVRFYDNANQIMPAGSNAAISATNGTLAFNGYTVPSGNSHGGTQTSFGLSHDGETALSQVSISLTTPLGTTTTLTIPVQLL